MRPAGRLGAGNNVFICRASSSICCDSCTDPKVLRYLRWSLEE